MSNEKSVAPEMQSNRAPVREETTNEHLKIVGQIPADLNGRYLRIGPNPRSGHAAHWFLGDGMIHGVELNKGAVSWYRNRYVRTPLYEKASEPSMLDLVQSLENSLANTHIISHAGKILALEELHLPYEVSGDLETIGAVDFNGRLKTGMTAHPKVCPKTGELLFFAYSLAPPYLTYHRVSAAGELVQSEPIEVKGATMMHDFNVTENFVIFMDLPLVYDLKNPGQPGLPVRWDEEYGARLGVMPRDGCNRDVVWYEIDPCYVFHPLNAYEEGDVIVLDVCRKDYAMKPNAPDSLPLLHRWEIDQRAGTVSSRQMSSISVEFPRLPDRLVGQRHRYGYFVERTESDDPYGIAIRKFDYETESFSTHTFASEMHVGEPVFVPTENALNEDDGYLLFFSYNPETNKSEFVILDARDVEKAPLATVKLEVRIPYGAHGSWIAD